MADRFSLDEVMVGDAYTNAQVITPDNATDLAQFTRAIWVGGVGNLGVQMVTNPDDVAANVENNVVFTAVPTATLMKIRVKKVFAANTTATNLVALW